MAFFVEADGNEKGDDAEPDRMDLELLAIGKRVGLSFDELNMLRVRDLIKFVSIYTGKEKEKPRKATQTDIDKFFS